MKSTHFIMIILLLISFHNTHANPWIPEQGIWKYSLDIASHHITPNNKEEFEKYILAEKTIALLYRRIDEIILKNVQDKENSKTQEDQRRLEASRDHRIKEITTTIEQLKLLQQYLYYNPILLDVSQSVEYGYNEYLSFGINSNFSKFKSGKNRPSEIFLKYRIWYKRGNILTISPIANFDKSMIGASAIFGSSKQFTPYLSSSDLIRGSIINKQEKEVFQYSSFGINQYMSNNFMKNQISYKLENNIGAKLNGNLLIIFQTTNHIFPGVKNLYGNILRKQIKIAKTFDLNHSKLSFHFGYFTIHSLSGKKYLTRGYSGGIWIEI